MYDCTSLEISEQPTSVNVISESQDITSQQDAMKTQLDSKSIVKHKRKSPAYFTFPGIRHGTAGDKPKQTNIAFTSTICRK